MKFLRQILLLSFMAITALNLDASIEKKQKSKLTQEQIEAKKEAGKAVREERAAKRVAQEESKQQELTEKKATSEERSEQDEQDSKQRTAGLNKEIADSDHNNESVDARENNDQDKSDNRRKSHSRSPIGTATAQQNQAPQRDEIDSDEKGESLEIHTDNSRKKDYSTMSLDRLSEEMNDLNKKIEELKSSNKKDEKSGIYNKQNEILVEVKKNEWHRVCRYYNEKYDAENRTRDSDVPMTIDDMKRMHESRAAIVKWLTTNRYTSRPTEQEATLSQQTNLLPKKYLDQYETQCEEQFLQKIAECKYWFYTTLTTEEKVIILARIQELQRVTEENEAKEQQLQETQSQLVVDTENTLQQ